ncbi:hypothetical protein BDW69DRAFT_141494 [Aspergillus filifer]
MVGISDVMIDIELCLCPRISCPERRGLLPYPIPRLCLLFAHVSPVNWGGSGRRSTPPVAVSPAQRAYACGDGLRSASRPIFGFLPSHPYTFTGIPPDPFGGQRAWSGQSQSLTHPGTCTRPHFQQTPGAVYRNGSIDINLEQLPYLFLKRLVDEQRSRLPRYPTLRSYDS